MPTLHAHEASRDGSSVGIIVQCPAHIKGQVSIYGENYGAVHRAAVVAWNDYQDTMAAEKSAAVVG